VTSRYPLDIDPDVCNTGLMSTDKSNESFVWFPEGTPEYAAYAAALKAELAKFVAGEPPYAPFDRDSYDHDSFDFDCF